MAEHVRNSDDVSEVMLGMPKEEYCKWIRNEMNWGGENEICFLCDKFNVEIQVVMMGVSSSSLTYGTAPGRRGRVYLLYTGQHYDALVGGDNPEVMPDAETRVFPSGEACEAFDKQVVLAANEHYIEDAKKAAMCVKKMLKCGGCGALLAGQCDCELHSTREGKSKEMMMQEDSRAHVKLHCNPGICTHENPAHKRHCFSTWR